jgi:hypothetical protein
MILIARLWHRWLHGAVVRGVVGDHVQWKCACGVMWMVRR